MGDTIGIELSTDTLDEPAFWRLVQWCHDHGASDFTVGVYGFGAGNRAQELMIDARNALVLQL